jgi:hypothetical protein
MAPSDRQQTRSVPYVPGMVAGVGEGATGSGAAGGTAAASDAGPAGSGDVVVGAGGWTVHIQLALPGWEARSRKYTGPVNAAMLSLK